MNLAMLLDLPSMIVADDVVLIDTSPADGPREVTYGELREGVGKMASYLMELGVGEGDRVGVFATNSAGAVEALFAPSYVGATVVPMNYRAGDEETAHLLADSGAKVLITESRYVPLVERCRPDALDAVIVLDDLGDHAAGLDAAESYPFPADVDDDGLATLLYTSGTTSMPKGVKLTHGALTGYVMGTNDAADGSDMGRMALAAPLYHIAGMTSLLNALYSGRVSVVMPQFEAGAWLDCVGAHRVTHAFLVPTMLARVIDHEGLGGADLSSLEAVTYGAAPMPPAVIRRAIDVMPASVSFAGAYGQTETTSTVAVLDPDDHDIRTGSSDEIEAKLRRLASVGKVLDDVQVRIVNEIGDVLGPGEVGEVQLMTFRAMDGYWGNEEKTRVTVDDEGWVHTGDLGYLDEADYLFLAGRSSDLIIRGGENIAPEEVEAVIYEHPDVMEAGVVGAPDEEWGEVVVAAVVARDGSGLDADGIIEHSRGKLAAFKRPTTVLMVDELPRTSTGKLLRRNLLPLFDD